MPSDVATDWVPGRSARDHFPCVGEMVWQGLFSCPQPCATSSNLGWLRGAFFPVLWVGANSRCHDCLVVLSLAVWSSLSSSRFALRCRVFRLDVQSEEQLTAACPYVDHAVSPASGVVTGKTCRTAHSSATAGLDPAEIKDGPALVRLLPSSGRLSLQFGVTPFLLGRGRP